MLLVERVRDAFCELLGTKPIALGYVYAGQLQILANIGRNGKRANNLPSLRIHESREEWDFVGKSASTSVSPRHPVFPPLHFQLDRVIL